MPLHDKFAKHEVLHTSYVVSDSWDRQVLEHHVVNADPELKEFAQKVYDLMNDFYQLCGKKFL